MFETVLFGLLGGMGLLLYGMHIMSESLQEIAGRNLRTILTSLTHNRFVALLVGIAITMLFQGSTATTVILVGLANASIITLQQSLGVLLGAGIGTTITAQLIALNITEIALPVVGLGVIFFVVARKPRNKKIGKVIVGFGLLFLGLKIMAGAMDPLGDSPFFRQMLLGASSYPMLAIAGGAFFTFIVHSSAAAVGIIMIMAMNGLVPIQAAIYLIFGANIGTCFTAVMSSFGASKEAQRVALANLISRIVGVAIMMPLITPFMYLLTLISSSPGSQAANAHTFFNIALAVLLLPFLNQFAALMHKIIPDQTEEDSSLKNKYLDEHFIATPSIALGLASREIDHAAEQVQDMIHAVISILRDKDLELLQKVNFKEDYLDLLCRDSTNYLMRVLRQPLNRAEFERGMGYMNIVNDLEMIGDIIERDISHVVKSKIKGGYYFSPDAWEEIKTMHQQLSESMRIAGLALLTKDADLAQQVMQLHEKIALLERQLRLQNFKRMEDGTARTMATSSLHLDLINAFLRISEHINNVCHEIVGQKPWLAPA